MLDEFLSGKSTSASIFVYYYPQNELEGELKDLHYDNNIFVTDGEHEKLRDKAVYFFRAVAEGKAVNLDNPCDHEVLFGELLPNTVIQLDSLVNNVYEPLIQSLDVQEWGECEEESRNEFLSSTKKFAGESAETIRSLVEGVSITTFDHREYKERENNEKERLEFLQRHFAKWLDEIERHLRDDADQRREGPEPGPRTELVYWRGRMQRITNLSEQLKSADFKLAKEELWKERTNKDSRNRGNDENIQKLMTQFNLIDITITDKLNEAKDNVKYLTTLEKFIEPLYTGKPQEIIDTLPALMSAIKMIYTIARYYNTTEKMTNLFVKVTNQMINNCKARIQEGGKNVDKIWDRNPEELIKELENCVSLNYAYQKEYNVIKSKVNDLLKEKQFDFNTATIFGKFDLFCRRVKKLIDIFSTIQQFNALKKHGFEGVGDITDRFDILISKFRGKRYDLLDYQNNKFDREFVQFNVEITLLDNDLQNFINSNFQRFRNIEYSLKLLKKFESILVRDSLKHDLSSKYHHILNNYAEQLTEIGTTFGKWRNDPPLIHNMPPTAGKIIWAKHLFQKIHKPIQDLSTIPINSQELKKYFGTYNNLGKQLTVYEMWYFQNWKNNIEEAKKGLQATLIVPHQKDDGSGRTLIVNFDLDVFELIREAKCLERYEKEIPDGAKIILLQEEKFKTYYNELNYLLREYTRILGKVKHITRDILKPHTEDLEFKLRPGMLTLTWTSMNIDAFLKHVHQGLGKLEQLIININDIIENRIENNLKAISKILLVNLPQESKPLSLEEFVRMQQEFIQENTRYLMSKNLEVETAVDDLLTAILSYPLDPHVDPVSQEEAKKIKSYYIWYLYQALLNSTQNSLNAMKHRVVGKRGQGQGNPAQLKPFFEVDVQLAGTVVKLNPSLEEIQNAINRAANAVLKCSKNLYNWNQQDKPVEERSSFYEMIAQEKEIVKVIIYLTGSIQGAKNKVNEVLSSFEQFEWLWRDSISNSLKEFNEKNPRISSYEEKLKIFNENEQAIEQIDQMFKIGAMALKTDNLKQGFIQWIKEWKTAFAEDLHKRAKGLLDQLSEQTKNLQGRLQKEVKDIDSLRIVMETLEEIRKQEAEIDMRFGPVFEMYDLYNQFLPNNVLDTQEMDARSVLRRNWQSLIEEAEVKKNELQLKQGSFLKELKEDVKNFIVDVSKFRKDYESNGPMVPSITPKDAIERLRRFEDEYGVREKKFEINRAGENLFGLKNQQYPALDKTKVELKNLKQLYDLYSKVIEQINEWRETTWSELSTTLLDEMEESIGKFGEQCVRLPKDLKEWNAYKELKLQIDNFKDILPILLALKKPSIQPRHWKQIIDITGKELNYEQEDGFYLNDLLEAHLLDHKEDIEDIADSADKQLKIQSQLEDIKVFWADAAFQFSQWKSREVPCVLNGTVVGEVTERLDEDSQTLASLNAQRHVAPFAKPVQDMILTLSDVAETLDQWVKVQVMWTNLEAVFTSGDIAKQMPLEAKKFQGIDKNWLKIMEKSSEIKKVVPCCQYDMLKTFLPSLQEGLEMCQKSLEQYLEGKRKIFPRFYFVSNPVLLKILSQGSDPESIQDDFEKLFDAIARVRFERADKKSSTRMITHIMAVWGKDEEIIELGNPLKCEGNIESWLENLKSEMQDTLKDISKSAWDTCLTLPLKDFINRYPAQIALLGIQMIWTYKMEEGLKRRSDKQLWEAKKKEIASVMDTLTAMCLEDLGTNLNRCKIETLVTIQVHQRDITAELKSKDENDFEWQKQTRIGWKNEVNDVIISITDWDAPYCYEYLGAKERLAITPLTDRCYITLAQAMSMYYGGAPAGPAGTGKTETVKDLGRTLGIFVVVTNCSDQHRYKDMAKIFKGLCQSGLWGCFDEFNRIDLEVLSVVAQQVEAVGSAKKQHLKEFNFPGEPHPIRLVESVGYFITMNPGYAGRQELPENLKVLFRGVAMMVPDREIIIKVKLASVGYSSYDHLAKKFRVLYGLCEEQLSKQRHYDFGLRNILSVLRTAGNTKREELKSDEEMLLMRTLRDMNLSKLVADDVALFKSLLTDIFPKQADPVKKVYPEIERKIKELVPARNLIFHEDWVLKVIQLYETCLVRHGFMLVGPTGTGKSTIMNLLTEAISEVKVPTKIQRMNPKAITSQEMYGVKSEISDDWIPGIFSEMWSKSNDKKQKVHTWIVCDGPVDAIWIENLNTVLDDNKILTLASGDRIPMSENCKMVFEVENLNNASPATVSRCGIVFVSFNDIGYEPIYKGWLLQRTKVLNRTEEVEKLTSLFEKYLKNFKVIDFEEKQLKNPVIEISSIIKVTNLLNLLTGILMPVVSQNRSLSNDEYERIFVWCLSWAFGGIYEAKERQEFHEWLVAKNAPMPPRGKDGETIFEYCLDTESKVGSVDFKLIVPDEWKPTERVQFSQLLMPTLDSRRAEILINYIANQPRSGLCSKSALLVGGSGTAKTSSVLMYASKFKEHQIFKRINFSSATLPNHFQASIEAECDTKAGKNYSPPGNKQMTVFIDDISMPFVNKWNDQITLEIVRQLVEQGGFYHLEKNLRGQFKNIINLQYLGAMNHPGGGRNDIPNRLKRQFFIFNMILPANVDSIYGSIIKHTFKPKFFSNEFNKVVDGLTSATIKIWNKVKNTLLPTPNKFHYVFNLRDLSRIFKGVLQVRKDVIMASPQTLGMKPEIFLIGLWKHECERVFVDKLINQKDKDQVIEYIQNITEESFAQHENEIREKLATEKPLYFCDFLRRDVINEEGVVEVEAERVYEAISDLEALRARCYELLNFYNTQYPAKKMNLVLFDDALKHLLRVSRIIKMPRSSGLLVGVGGSGKQSLTRLAAYIGKNVTYQIRITKNFGEKDLKEELKGLMEITGHQGKPTTFILTDAEVKQEGFLEYINMVLSTGEIPGLIAKDEKEAWLGDIRAPYLKEKGLGNFDPPQSELYQYFVDRLRDNFHIMLCFSPVGSKFRERARKFPALFNECTIDWFLPWPEEALVSVANRFITEFKELDTTNEVKEALQKHMGQVHLMVNSVCELYFQKLRRQVYVTPKSFLSFIDSYKGLYMKKYFEELDVQEKRYKIGLQKIEEAQQSIAEMSVVLKEEEVLVKKAADATEVLLKDLEKENKKAKVKQDEVEATANACQAEASTIATQKEDAQKDLAAALPALEAAKDAVNSIQQPQITELKAMKNPLEIMKYVMDCVCIMIGRPLAPIKIEDVVFNKKENKTSAFLKDSWEEGGRGLLSDMDFLKLIKNENLGNMINEEHIELLQPYFNTKDEFFNQENAKKASVAVEALCKWVLALALFYEKSKIVKPKIEFLTIQEGKLAVAMTNLGKAQADLEEVKAFVAQLKEKYQKQIEEKNILEDRMRKMKKKIDQAKKLIDSLTDEKERWTKGRDEITDQKRRLVGNVSMACAFISYCGPFNAEFRTLLVNEYFIGDMKKKQIPCQVNLDLTKFLVDDATIGEWNLQGLPKDDLSIQNGIMVTASSRFPLLIDPQGQGGFWIKNKYAEFIDPRRSITTLTHPKFKDFFLKFCMEEGKTLIIEGIENEVDPILDPVLEKQINQRGKTRFIDVGGSEIEWTDAFKMFLTCKLANPSFSPELSAKTTIIDFTVTQGGLEQQLLGRLLSKEKKALEESLNTLLTDVTQNKKNLQLLDKSLLEKLTESQGNLLEDQELVEVLNTTKTESKNVQTKLIEAEVKTKEINEQREQFRPVAIRGSVLYFCIIELSLVNWMYNSSLGQFLQLFDYAIDNSEKAPQPTKRCENIVKYLTYHVYRYINRGLFERDKVTYLLMVCFNLMLRDNKITGGDVAMFLKGGSTLDVTERSPMKFMEDAAWNNCRALTKHVFQGETVPFFRELIQSIERNENVWKTWLEGNNHDKNSVPDFSERLNADKEIGPFLHLCLVRCIREDRTLVAAQNFISDKLGPEYVAPVTDSIESIWQESLPMVPVLFLLSAGADPTSIIDDFSKKRKKIYCDKVSMGEGQDKYADESIKNGMITGTWTILQNCHLGLQFMQFLDSFLVQEQPNINPEFRLFITCEPSPRFPLGLLQKCIKVTNEPPKGIKAGLHKTFTTLVNQDFLDKIEHRNWSSLVFSVCFMHSIVQERRKFGPLGWCVPYEFNNSDLEASLMFIEKYLNTFMGGPVSGTPNLPIKWDVVNYMVCQVQYGGRITDDLDREMFDVYGLQYLNDKLFGDPILADTPQFKYRLPQGVEITKYREYIDHVPAIDTPEVFGLHPNADLTFRLKESNETINTIMETRPKDSGAGAGKTREEEVLDRARDYLSKLPAEYIDADVRDLIRKLPGPRNLPADANKGFAVPLNIFLYQELQRMQRVISLVRKTLVDAIDAIDGIVIMTPFLLDAINAIYDGKVPYDWLYDPSGAEISWLLMKLSTWMDSLGKRNEQLNNWLRTGRPQTFWLGGFFNPQGFLTAMKQEVTRMHKGGGGGGRDKAQEAWSLDDVIYFTAVKEHTFEQIKDVQSEGVYVRELFLESATWGKGSLEDPPEKKNFYPLPLLYVSAIQKKKTDADKASNTFSCPVYKYPRRTDKYLIFRVNLECGNKPPSFWKLRGVALHCFTEN